MHERENFVSTHYKKVLIILPTADSWHELIMASFPPLRKRKKLNHVGLDFAFFSTLYRVMPQMFAPSLGAADRPRWGCTFACDVLKFLAFLPEIVMRSSKNPKLSISWLSLELGIACFLDFVHCPVF
jgi:hypothetical protein